MMMGNGHVAQVRPYLAVYRDSTREDRRLFLAVCSQFTLDIPALSCRARVYSCGNGLGFVECMYE